METVDAADQVESESQSFVQWFSPDVAGIYAFCVDNSRSRFMPKKIEVCALFMFTNIIAPQE